METRLEYLWGIDHVVHEGQVGATRITYSGNHALLERWDVQMADERGFLDRLIGRSPRLVEAIGTETHRAEYEALHRVFAQRGVHLGHTNAVNKLVERLEGTCFQRLTGGHNGGVRSGSSHQLGVYGSNKDHLVLLSNCSFPADIGAVIELMVQPFKDVLEMFGNRRYKELELDGSLPAAGINLTYKNVF